MSDNEHDGRKVDKRGRSPSPRKSPSPKRRRSPSPRRRDSRSPSPRRSPPPRRSPRRSPRNSRSPRRSYSRSPSPRRQRAFGTDRDRQQSSSLYVGNLPRHFRERDIEDMFSSEGKIRNLRLGANKVGSVYAFIEYEDRRDAEDSLRKYDGTTVDGSRVRVDWDVGLQNKRRDRPFRGRGGFRGDRGDRGDRGGRSGPYTRRSPPPRDGYGGKHIRGADTWSPGRRSRSRSPRD